MPVQSRRTSLVTLESGETGVVLTEPAQYSIPLFQVYADGANTPDILQKYVWPMGTRVAYYYQTSQANHKTLPTPILVRGKSSENEVGANECMVLHNAIDPQLTIDKTTKTFHLMWWWNGWSPDFKKKYEVPGTPANDENPVTSLNETLYLPRPPEDFYLPHSVPHPKTPAWYQSVVPKISPPTFDSRRPFWIAPLADGYQYDYYGDDALKIGVSQVDGPNRVPETPGVLKIQDMIRRGLIEWPKPNLNPDISVEPSKEWNLWALKQGIRNAGAYIAEAARRDFPSFVSTPSQDIYTDLTEYRTLPGNEGPLAKNVTIEDLLLIVNALKAHLDNTNLGGATRVLMYARGTLMENVSLKTVPTRWVSHPKGGKITHDPWPSQPEIVKEQTILVFDAPKPVVSYTGRSNSRTLINPDMVIYPTLDSTEVSWQPFTDGRVSDSYDVEVTGTPAVDWTLGDPTPCAAKTLDVFKDVVDPRSF